jgi:hypothetical protein
MVQSNGYTSSIDLQTKLQDKPFWIFDKEQHQQEDIRTKGECCFWHCIGCPQKDGKDMPVLPYQKILYDALQNHKHIFILKSRGIGCSEFLLRYIAWCCICSKFGAGSRVCIITGPRIDLAEDLIARFKGLLAELGPPNHNDRNRTQSTVAYLNGVRVEAFPSHHVDTMRGLTDVKFILSDESDMYPLFQQREVRAVMEGYIGKPNNSNNKYYCSHCNTRLVTLTQEDKKGGYICTKCIIEYWPNQQPVKKSSHFETPGPNTDSHGNVVGDKTIPIAMIEDIRNEVSSTTYKQQKLPAAYEALKRQGFNFVN